MSAFSRLSLLARLLSGVAIVAAAVGSTASCGTKDSPGAVMLGMSTDMVVPVDVASVGLYIYAGIPGSGAPIYSVKRTAVKLGGINKVSFPSTFAVVATQGKTRQIRVRLVAFGADDQPRVLREAVTTIPTARTSYLRMALSGINDGTVKAAPTSVATKSADQLKAQFSGNIDEFEGLTVPDCPVGLVADPTAEVKTFDENGLCVSALVAEADMPDYSDALAFGGGTADGKGATCFPLATCFGSAEKIAVSADCTLSGVNNLNSRTIALDALKGPTYPVNGSDGMSHYYVPLTEAAFVPKSGNTKLDPAYCARYLAMIQSEKVLGLYAANPSCGIKSLDAPLCEVFPQAEKQGTTGDGGTAPDGGAVDAGPSSCPAATSVDGKPVVCVNTGGEPNVMGIAAVNGRVYVARTDQQSIVAKTPYINLVSYPIDPSVDPSGAAPVDFGALYTNGAYSLSGYRLTTVQDTNSRPYIVMTGQGTVTGALVSTAGQVVVYGPLGGANPAAVRLDFAPSVAGELPSFFAAVKDADGFLALGLEGNLKPTFWQLPVAGFPNTNTTTGYAVQGAGTLNALSAVVSGPLNGAPTSTTRLIGLAQGDTSGVVQPSSGRVVTPAVSLSGGTNITSMVWEKTPGAERIYAMYTTGVVVNGWEQGGILAINTPGGTGTLQTQDLVKGLSLASFPNTNEMTLGNGKLYFTDALGNIQLCEPQLGKCQVLVSGEHNPRALTFYVDASRVARLLWTTREDPTDVVKPGNIRSVVVQ